MRKISQKNRRKNSGLMSLIDVVFLLLIFFLVVSVFVNSEVKEYSVNVSTPINEEGMANILIQITDNGDYYFMDDDFFLDLDNFFAKTVHSKTFWNNRKSNYKTERFQLFLNSACKKGVKTFEGYPIPDNLLPYTKSGIQSKIRVQIQLVRDDIEKNGSAESFKIMVRCPYRAKYGEALVIVEALNQPGVAKEFFQYGISGGALADFTERGTLGYTEGDNPEMMLDFVRPHS
jgi:biopolymer transport protein ExbD